LIEDEATAIAPWLRCIGQFRARVPFNGRQEHPTAPDHPFRSHTMQIRSPLTVAALAALASCTAPDSSPTALHPTTAAFAAAKFSNPTATFVLSNDAAYQLRGDGLSLDPDAGSRYANGDCGVSTVIYALAGGSGDATLDAGSPGKCRRKVSITYQSINADGSTTSEGSLVVPSFLNVRKLQVAASGSTPSNAIPIGTTATRTFAFSDDGAKCGNGGTGAISFDPVLYDGTVTNSDFVQVHRDAADSWTVTTLPDDLDIDGHVIHHDRAYCKGNGKLYHMPVHFTIKSSVPLFP
jgi:hypothetical protein